MPALSRAKKKPATVSLRDLLETDAQVVCLDSFRPGLVARLIPRGSYLALDDPVVEQFPSFFGPIVRLDALDDLREIER